MTEIAEKESHSFGFFFYHSIFFLLLLFIIFYFLEAEISGEEIVSLKRVQGQNVTLTIKI